MPLQYACTVSLYGPAIFFTVRRDRGHIVQDNREQSEADDNWWTSTSLHQVGYKRAANTSSPMHVERIPHLSDLAVREEEQTYYLLADAKALLRATRALALCPVVSSDPLTY